MTLVDTMDEISNLVPEHKRHLDDTDEVDNKKVNSTRKHLKSRTTSFSAEPVDNTADVSLSESEDLEEKEVTVDAMALKYYPTVEFRQKVTDNVMEFFENEDVPALRDFVVELEDSIDNIVPTLIITFEIAMSKHDKDRELASTLLVKLQEMDVCAAHFENTFNALLVSLSELVVDIPKSATFLSYFLARAVADEVLRPAFLQDRLEDTREHVSDCVRTAYSLWTAKHGFVMLEQIWGGRRSIDNMVAAMTASLNEYLTNGDLKEAEKEILDWHVPHFMHEYVYEAIIMAIRKKDDDKCKKIHALLKYLSAHVEITIDQFELGFDRVREEIPEMKIDFPTSEENFKAFCATAKQNDYLAKYYEC